MSEKAIKRQVRLALIEYLLAHVMMRQYERMGLSRQAIFDSHDRMIGRLANEPLSEFDPAMSDHLTAELEEAALRFVSGLEKMMGLERTPNQQ